LKTNIKAHLFVSFLLLTFQLGSCLSSRKTPQKDLAKADNVKPFDAIIVPGVPFKKGSWDSVMKARVLWSYILYKNGYTKNVIYSGSSVYSPYYEGMIMGLYAEKLGIPKEHIVCETKARHSTENIYYSYLLAKQKGFKTIALATDPFQSSMLKGFTRKRFETQIYHVPFIADSVQAYNYLNPTIDPTPAQSTNFVSITKQESFFHRLQGTMGKDINWGLYKNGKVGSL
jgi:hypothetical protein